MDFLHQEYKACLKDKQFIFATILSVLLLAISLVANYYAGFYASNHESNPVTDLVLSNIRVYNVEDVFVYGSIIFWTFIALLCIARPAKAPFTIKAVALFTLIRSVFVMLTHIGPFPTQIILDSNLISKFTFGGDLFFSGHTGLPFLMALIFWHNKTLRYVFMATSLLFAVVVLMAHLHYSIDVLGAFFITYSIYRLAEIFFKKDKRIFNEGLPQEGRTS